MTDYPNVPHAIIYFDQELHDETGHGWILECSTWDTVSYRYSSLSVVLQAIEADPFWHIELTGPVHS